MNAINHKIGIGVIWNFANLFFSKGSTTLFTLILAKFIAPEAFGLVAMATIVFELANAFVQSGLGQAIIRSKSVTQVDLNTVFYSNIALSLIAYSIIFLVAPYVADFYSQPELLTLVQVMGLTVFINAARVVPMAVLSREMDFKSQMKANTTGAVCSGVLSLLAAYNGWGVWSLVIMMLGQTFISSALFWLSCSWRPSLIFSTRSFVKLFGFGKNLLAEGMLEVMFQNSYVLVIGRFFSAEITGLYFFAKKMSNLIPQQITAAVQQATFPALSTLQDNNEILRYKYRQIMQLMVFLIAPIMALIGSLASPLFELFFDEEWYSAVPYLQLLCIVGALYPLHALNVNLLKVKGRSDLVLKAGFIKKAINITLLLISIPYGVFAIALSQVAGSFIALIPNTYYSSKLISYNLLSQLVDAGKPMLAAVFSTLLVLLVFNSYILSSMQSIIVGFLLFCLSFLSLSYILKAQALTILLRKIKKQC